MSMKINNEPQFISNETGEIFLILETDGLYAKLSNGSTVTCEDLTKNYKRI